MTADDFRKQDAGAAEPVAQIAISLPPGLLEGFERSQLPARRPHSSKFRWCRRLRTPQEIDMTSHFRQHTEMTLGFGDEARMKGSNRRDVTLGIGELWVATGGGHGQSKCMPHERRS